MAKITAISSLGWAHYSLYEALPRMAARGFKRVEFASFDTFCFHFNYGSPTPTELKGMLQQHDLEPICSNYACSGAEKGWLPESIDAFVRSREKKLPHLAEVGIPMMTMHFGSRNDRPDQEKQLANAVKAYDRVAAIAESFGVRTVLEVPHLYQITYGPEQVMWVFERLESGNVGALVDSSHWGISGYDIDEFLGRLGDRLWHIHLRDSAGSDTADGKQALEMTPGSGSVDFARLGQALDRAGYRGDVSIEFEYRDLTLEAIEREYDRGLRHLADVGWEFPPHVRIP